MSLKDGTKKMSKSDPSDLSRINLTDEKDSIINKIKKAKTDTKPMPNSEREIKARPEIENLIGIYSSLTNQQIEKTLNEFSGKNFSDFKTKLAEVVVEKIEPISTEIDKLKNDSNYVDSILLEGSEKAYNIASKKIIEIKKILGF